MKASLSSENQKIVLGLDPGSRLSGYAVIALENKKTVHIHHGVIRLPTQKKMPQRLIYFANEFKKILREFKPNEFAIETIFTGKNIQSILKIGQVRGVALMLAAEDNCKIFEYPPAAIKMAIAGYGRATKEQINFMVQKLLRLKQKPYPLDVSDALAIAICHIQTTQIQRKLGHIS